MGGSRGEKGVKHNSFNSMYGVNSMGYYKFIQEDITDAKELSRKKALDRDIQIFYRAMNQKYPELEIAISGSITYANSWTMRSSRGEPKYND